MSAPSWRANQSNITKFVVPLAAATSLPSRSFSVLTSGRDGDDRAPEIEQVEQIRHLDAADIGETDRQQRGAAAELELAGVELRGVGVGRALLELDGEAVLLVELLRLDDRRQERAERRRAEHDDRERLRRLRQSRRSRQPARDTQARLETNVFMAILPNFLVEVLRSTRDRRLDFLAQCDKEPPDQVLRHAAQDALADAGHQAADLAIALKGQPRRIRLLPARSRTARCHCRGRACRRPTP